MKSARDQLARLLQQAASLGLRPALAAPAPARRVRAALVGGVLAAAGVLGLGLYQLWSDARQTDALARALTGGEPDRAGAIATRYGCGGCHTIAGLPGADGQVAPSLSGLRQRVFVGTLRNTPDNVVAWIVDPRAYAPSSAMPRTGISAAEARDMAAYLYGH